ncbi:DUF402 domain-containing protein [Paenibacillus doosanensis]|uniref:DUF402 domain-containing protein n=1 Tax=Paenibacillus konkukensis TaxID=2020716 RepID=A0ABY4RWX4_9BACL|nr:MULTISPECIES: DUF402 domain-containing protein [Paenibacillus]MCS7458659.1 DUF402 domain-containing protein [Paenibacillus doosanensis]UQZ86817.1 hypothetical protein SK3146_06110 [Paenibacillus konkukensis]
MKRKIANRPGWGRVVRKRYEQSYVDDGIFRGYIAILRLDEVREPLRVTYGESDTVCIADDGYAWLMLFPADANYSLTVMADAGGRVVQWYFDIIQSMELNSEGIPVIYDWYLDLVLLPNRALYVLDEDEWREAMLQGELSEKDGAEAAAALNDLKRRIECGEHEWVGRTEHYFGLFGTEA